MDIEDMVRRILEVASGERPVAEGERLINPAVVLHLGRITMRGRRTWRDFVSYLRHRRQKTDWSLCFETTRRDGSVVEWIGHWRNEVSNASSEVRAKFRVEHEQVVEIWSRRKNYTPIFGKSFLNGLGLSVTALRGFVWCRVSRPKEIDANKITEPSSDESAKNHAAPKNQDQTK